MCLALGSGRTSAGNEGQFGHVCPQYDTAAAEKGWFSGFVINDAGFVSGLIFLLYWWLSLFLPYTP